MSDPVALITRKGKVSTVSLNRPNKLNALNHASLEHASELLHQADNDPDSSVIVLNGIGRAFCVGYDITAELEGDTSWRSDPSVWRDYLHRCLDFEMLPMNLKKPVIASVLGYAVGGGCELAMFCDLTICGESAKFGEPEARFSNPGPAMIMPFIVGHKKARELLYMGDMIDADTALACGMVNRVVADENLEAETEKLATRMALIDPETLQATKLALRKGIEASGIPQAMREGVDVLAPLYATDTESGKRFMEIVENENLGAALNWRMSQFED